MTSYAPPYAFRVMTAMLGHRRLGVGVQQLRAVADRSRPCSWLAPGRKPGTSTKRDERDAEGVAGADEARRLHRRVDVEARRRARAADWRRRRQTWPSEPRDTDRRCSPRTAPGSRRSSPPSTTSSTTRLSCRTACWACRGRSCRVRSSRSAGRRERGARRVLGVVGAAGTEQEARICARHGSDRRRRSGDARRARARGAAEILEGDLLPRSPPGPRQGR